MENREELLDPFCIKQEQWVDDLKLWPIVEYSDIYNYLIDTKGLLLKRVYKSLEAFNFFHSRHVYYFEVSSSSAFAVLIAKVNPSQKSPSDPHEAWVVVNKQSGTVTTWHCTCMAG